MPVDEPFAAVRITGTDMAKRLLSARTTADIPKRPSSGWDPKNQPRRFAHRDIYD